MATVQDKFQEALDSGKVFNTKLSNFTHPSFPDACRHLTVDEIARVVNNVRIDELDNINQYPHSLFVAIIQWKAGSTSGEVQPRADPKHPLPSGSDSPPPPKRECRLGSAVTVKSEPNIVLRTETLQPSSSTPVGNSNTRSSSQVKDGNSQQLSDADWEIIDDPVEKDHASGSNADHDPTEHGPRQAPNAVRNRSPYTYGKSWDVQCRQALYHSDSFLGWVDNVAWELLLPYVPTLLPWAGSGAGPDVAAIPDHCIFLLDEGKSGAMKKLLYCPVGGHSHGIQLRCNMAFQLAFRRISVDMLVEYYFNNRKYKLHGHCSRGPTNPGTNAEIGAKNCHNPLHHTLMPTEEGKSRHQCTQMIKCGPTWDACPHDPKCWIHRLRNLTNDRSEDICGQVKKWTQGKPIKCPQPSCDESTQDFVSIKDHVRGEHGGQWNQYLVSEVFQLGPGGNSRRGRR
ncbi:MAG: hypothetical protein M1831_000540 [Alyxoria varia]|nr:MAG: hypothetical protein M1831_000540 [Alyxoria varia]